MCYRPVKLFNNTNSLRAIDSIKFMAPCGECEECRTIRACEYTFRVYNEMEYCSKNGYNLFFGTLTYNDSCLPSSSIVNKFNKSASIKCFRRSDVEKFFKQLRKYLLQKYGVKGISYVCASEYGSHTQRPHYHFELSVPKFGVLLHKGESDPDYLEVGDVVELTSELIHSKVVELWTYGFVFPRYSSGGYDGNGYFHKPFQIDIENIKAAAFYVSKYCCKDLTFYGLPEVVRYKDICNSFIHGKFDDDVKLLYKRKLREHMTFVHTSRHFGEHINDLVKTADDLVNGVSTTMNTKKLVPVPTYNKRKLVYKVRTVKDDPSIKVLDKVCENFNEDRYLDLLYMYKHIYKVKPNYSYIRSLCTSVLTKYKYKVRYDLTSLGKEYSVKYMKNRISDTKDAIEDFVKNTVYSKEFREWYINTYSTYDYNYDGTKSSVVTANYSGFVSKVSRFFCEDKFEALSVYLNVYCNRVSPLHLQFYLNDKDFIYEKKEKVMFTKVLHPIFNGKTSMSRIRKEVVEVCTEKFKPLSRISAHRQLSWTTGRSVKFLGSESLSDMVSKSLDFYMSNLDFDRYNDEGKVNVKEVALQSLVQFNSFPCFKCFDEFLSIYKKYKSYCNESIYETRAKRNRQIQYYKQAISEVEY